MKKRSAKKQSARNRRNQRSQRSAACSNFEDACGKLHVASFWRNPSLGSQRVSQFAEAVASADMLKDSFDASGLSACVEGDDAD